MVAINYTGTTNRSEFTYDGLSRCVKIVEKTNGSVISTRKFVWCGMEKCEFRDANDAVTLFAYPQGQHSGGVKYFYSRDHLGSIREMFKNNGTVVARFDYDPWGRSTTVINTTLPDFNFTGLYRHSASNLDMAVRRFYDPELGRWLSRDPIGEQGGLNLYDYVENNVPNAIDPVGLVTFFVHGTWSSNSTFSSAFVRHVADYYHDPKLRFFDWSGRNNAAARAEGAKALAHQLSSYHRAHPCEPIRVVGHSHGGNVALDASQENGVYVDELVTLGTPIVPAYQPGNIGIWNNVSSSADFVQTHAFPFADNGRDDPTANNIHIRHFGHTELQSIAAWDAAFGH